ncbi:hypothetical protein [Nonomuraea gerenzanensis]|uniref:Uncharacterized protein n=1 Tax=Nonomuraea gerenzanensis TaxID=93944 RepID=A0A1M4E5M5_9ACTN|nr:hypothetical protein [Nonomuraea gerenzanensis]UBU16259.1 hypothetical protein LCN96_14955 [Nonomuraea gerenzanensis]SBO94074.1 hypothetical protein BN4615_P3590 [Nonomuraea gerenzanensis]
MSVTPEQLRALATRAEALTAEVWTLCGGSPGTAPGTTPDADPLVEARQAAGWLARAAEDLQRAAAELARLQVPPCGLPWGVCLEHGNTLSSRAGVSECRVCHRTWSYDRLGRPCEEPATWKVIDRAGTVTRMCDGHVLGARAAAQGATFVRIDEVAGRAG